MSLRVIDGYIRAMRGGYWSALVILILVSLLLYALYVFIHVRVHQYQHSLVVVW